MKLDEKGLVPVVVQDHLTGEVRMVAYASADAIERTRVTGRATFFSRSRGELWEKGATSGNVLAVRRVLIDCDDDTLLYLVEPSGPTCHTGAPSCFFRELDEDADDRGTTAPKTTALARLEATLETRRASTAEKSYTKSLYDAGPARIAAKIREEGDELARAVEGESDARVVSEAADVLYHLAVGLTARGIPLRAVLVELEKRASKSGHEEKASRGSDP